MKFYVAPLEGVTGYIYRNALEKYFPGADCYFTPFIVPDQKHPLRKKELRDILPENNHVKNLVPQILTNDADRFHEAVQENHIWISMHSLRRQAMHRSATTETC